MWQITIDLLKGMSDIQLKYIELGSVPYYTLSSLTISLNIFGMPKKQ